MKINQKGFVGILSLIIVVCIVGWMFCVYLNNLNKPVQTSTKSVPSQNVLVTPMNEKPLLDNMKKEIQGVEQTMQQQANDLDGMMRSNGSSK